MSDLGAYAVATGISLFALVRTCVKVPLPEKWPWFIGFGLVALSALFNLLYAYGGRYVVLAIVLVPLKCALDTTGSLALAIGSYSSMHEAKVSAHWYSLPTGSAPLAMLYQYVPSQYIQLAFFVIVIVYSVGAKYTGAPTKKFLVPFVVMTAASVVRELGVDVKVVSTDALHAVAFAVGVLILSFLATKDTLQIGKTKIG